jgi:hypothetical protein
MASWEHAPEESEERSEERDTIPRQDRNGDASHCQVRSQEVRKICIEVEVALDWVVLTRARNLLSREDVESHFESEVLENSNMQGGEAIHGAFQSSCKMTNQIFRLPSVAGF